MHDRRTPTSSSRTALAQAVSRLLVVCAALLPIASSTRAEPELTLAWRGAQGCPSSAWASARMAARLERPLDDVPRGVSAEITLERDGKGYRARLHTQDPDGSVGDRELRGATCKEVAEAAVLVLSLTVSMSADQRAQAEEEVEVGHQLDDSELAPFRRRRAIRAIERARPFSMGMGLLVDWGVRDLPAPGPVLGLAYQFRRLRFELAGVWLPQAEVERSARTDVRAKVSLGAVRAGVCARAFEASAVSFAGCARVEVGTEQARGQGLGPGGGRARALWAGAELGVRISRIFERRLELGFGAGALIVANRPRFLVQGNDGDAITLQRSWPVSARILLDLGYRF